MNKTTDQIAAKAWEKITWGNACDERAIPIIKAAIEEAAESAYNRGLAHGYEQRAKDEAKLRPAQGSDE